MNSYLDKINKDKIPNHVAIIMDGNGRWAKSKSMPRIFGHNEGVKTVRELTEAAGQIGVKYLSLFAFSTENWKRPALEVNALMTLLVSTIDKELNTLMKNNVKLEALGNIASLPSKSYKSLLYGIEKTKNNSGLKLILALNYSGKWSLLDAVNKIVDAGIKTPISEADFVKYMDSNRYPDPDLLIRTGGEFRISNFYLWEAAYSELYFSEVMWPEFKSEYFYEAIYKYQNRERRYGKISEQLKDNN